MHKWRLTLFILFAVFHAPYGLADYSQHPKAIALTQELTKSGFKAEYLQRILESANRNPKVLELISRPLEKVYTWKYYRRLFINQKQVKAGLLFWKQYKVTLSKVSKNYGVPTEIIVAIIGIETRYGQNMGNFRVIDALCTLGFDYPKRSTFFTHELKAFLRLSAKEHIDPLKPRGSYAGAMGYGQFMPSSFLEYAVDFTQDGKRDIWANPEDAIASVANYLARHGWRKKQPIACKAFLDDKARKNEDAVIQKTLELSQRVGVLRKQGWHPKLQLADSLATRALRLLGERGQEYWLALHNFYVITRYNHSDLYAMAVTQLGAALRKAYLP